MNIIRILIGLMILAGCQNEAVQKGRQESSITNFSNPICRQVDFTQNILTARNIENVFGCLDWNTHYSNFYSKLKEKDLIDSAVMIELNQVFNANPKWKSKFHEFYLKKPKVISQLNALLYQLLKNPQTLSVFTSYVEKTQYSDLSSLVRLISIVKDQDKKLFGLLQRHRGRISLILEKIPTSSFVENFYHTDITFNLNKINQLGPMYHSNLERLVKSLKENTQDFRYLLNQETFECRVDNIEITLSFKKELKDLFITLQNLSSHHELASYLENLYFKYEWARKVCSGEELYRMENVMKTLSLINSESAFSYQLSLLSRGFKRYQDFFNAFTDDLAHNFIDKLKPKDFIALEHLLQNLDLRKLEYFKKQNKVKLKSLTSYLDNLSQEEIVLILEAYLSVLETGELDHVLAFLNDVFVKDGYMQAIETGIMLERDFITQLRDLSYESDYQKFLDNSGFVKLFFLGFGESDTMSSDPTSATDIFIPSLQSQCLELISRELSDGGAGEIYTNSLCANSYLFSLHQLFYTFKKELGVSDTQGIGTFEKKLITHIMLLSSLYKNVNRQYDFIDDFLNSIESGELNILASAIMKNSELVSLLVKKYSTLKKDETRKYIEDLFYYQPHYLIESCQENEFTLINECHGLAQTQKKLGDFVTNVFKNFNGKKTQLRLLIDAFNPSGVYAKKYGYHISFSDLTNFFYHFSKTKSKISLKKGGKEIYIELNLLQQLQIILKEISFLNNFYGAYFVNELADAKNFKRKLKSFKRELRLMQRSADFFIQREIFPKDTKERLYNIYSSFQALEELYLPISKVVPGSDHFTKLAQAILRSMKYSSPVISQSFHPFRRPDQNLVMNHSVNNLTMLFEISTINRLKSAMNIDQFGDEQRSFIQVLDKHFSKKFDFNNFINSLEKLNRKKPELLQSLVVRLSKWYFHTTKENQVRFWSLIGNLLESYGTNFQTNSLIDELETLFSILAHEKTNLDFLVKAMNSFVYSTVKNNNSNFNSKVSGDISPFLKLLKNLSHKKVSHSFESLFNSYSKLHDRLTLETLNDLIYSYLQKRPKSSDIENHFQLFIKGGAIHKSYTNGQLSRSILYETLDGLEIIKTSPTN
jgi:hypothetical protein